MSGNVPDYVKNSHRPQRPRIPRTVAWQIATLRMREPFLDSDLKDDIPPRCTLERLEEPRLRRCPYDLRSLKFLGPINPKPDFWRLVGLDGGIDGYNWKARLGRDGPTCALKLFWDTEPRHPVYASYFAPQRECHNAAILEMMQGALSEESAGLGPILIDPRPQTQEAAEANFFAFCEENRRKNSTLQNTNLVPLTQIPRMRKCYGWMQFTGEELLRRLPKHLIPPPYKMNRLERAIDKKTRYTAIVYEFIEDGADDPAAAQAMLDFLWRAGFSHVPVTKANNWQSGVLLDHSDIVHCWGPGWDQRFFGYRTTKEILR